MAKLSVRPQFTKQCLPFVFICLLYIFVSQFKETKKEVLNELLEKSSQK